MSDYSAEESFSSKERVAWVDYSKGICIIAVVCLYTTQHLQDASGSLGWMQYWVDFARPFRMPDFFLLSGLFLSRTINAPWRDYIDKKVIHFFYFFALWTTIYFALNLGFKGEIQDVFARNTYWKDYLSWYVKPFHMLWFIEMLPIYFVVTRLLKNTPWPFVLTAAAILQIVNINPELGQISRFCQRYVYFYAGYIFAPLIFRCACMAAENRMRTGFLLIGWAVINEMFVAYGLSQVPGIGLMLGFAGTGAVIAVGSLLSTSARAAWLRYLGQNSIVIFLSFFIFTVSASKFFDKFSIIHDAGTRQLFATFFSVLGPVVLFWFLRGTPAIYLFKRPRWAFLPATRKSPQSLELLPAEVRGKPHLTASPFVRSLK